MRALTLLLPYFLFACDGDQTIATDKVDTGNGTGNPDDTDTADTGTPAVEGPDIDVAPTELDFGTISADVTATGIVTVTNVGNAPLTASVAVTIGEPTFRANTTGAYLVPGAVTDITISFASTTLGAYTGALTLTSDDPDEPTVVVALSGTIESDSDGDGYVDSEDCDPNDATVNPGATDTWYDGIDSNCDGASDYDQDGDGYDTSDNGGNDCDDTNAAINPNSDEVWYDGTDENCDGRSDYDQDGDGYDSVDYGGDDCDDENAAASPGTLEVEGNGFDDDCDGSIDEARSTEDLDGDGFSEVDGDCNDDDVTINPGATEVYYDGLDQDCDGASDYDMDLDGYDDVAYGGDDCFDVDASINPGATETYYDGVDQDCSGDSDYDADMDGYDSAAWGYDDCDDADANVYPGASDAWYDGIDGNCDGASDFDMDGDGQDDAAYGGGDCNDADTSIYTGATEVCDGIDQDCDGTADNGATTAYYTDGDGDGYGDPASVLYDCSAPTGYIEDGTDCDDGTAEVSPAEAEVCDYLDNDCDGVVDDSVKTKYYKDGDGDGYGDSAISKNDCSTPTGYTTDKTDCNDSDATINPAATEICDGIDQDCDGVADDGLGGSVAYYADSDGDGYGDPTASTTSCTAPSGYVTDNTDCDDTEATTNPGADEIGYDVADNDCDRIQDEMVADDWTNWTVTGSDSSDNVGSGGLLTADDLDQDGNNELVIGSPAVDLYYYYYTLTSSGHVGFHDQDTMDTPEDVEAGFYDVYGGSYDTLGADLAMANTDGGTYVEVAMSAPYDATGGTYAGTVYVFDIYGESGTDWDYGPAEGIIEGTSSDGHYGSALAFGDMDGDGDPDLAGGAPGASSSRGRVYVSLNSDGYASSTMDASDSSYYVRGVSNTDYLGTAVEFGDFNDDGYDDLVMCSPGDDDGGSAAGTCWIDFGQSSPSESDETVSSVDDAVITGNAASANLGGTTFGLAVGDFDNDGVDDLAVGVDGYSDVAANAGAIAIWAGGSLSGSETVGTADWFVRGGTASGYLGYSAHFGDITGDGTDDLLVGATGDGTSAEGVLYLFEGGQATGTYDLPVNQYASWSGPSASSLFGFNVTGEIDLDDDGTNDFAVSAPYSDASDSNGGEVYVLPTY